MSCFWFILFWSVIAKCFCIVVLAANCNSIRGFVCWSVCPYVRRSRNFVWRHKTPIKKKFYDGSSRALCSQSTGKRAQFATITIINQWIWVYMVTINIFFNILLQRFIQDFRNIEASNFFRDIAIDFMRSEAHGWSYLVQFFSGYNSSLLNLEKVNSGRVWTGVITMTANTKDG